MVTGAANDRRQPPVAGFDLDAVAGDHPTFDGRNWLMSAKPPVHMFMSADIVGSTAFKGAAQAAGEDWLQAFETLFRELPLVFIGKLAEAFLEADDLPASGVWKVMGDEMIFLASVRNAGEAAGVLAAFAATVADYDHRLSQRWPLKVRGCCWAVEFGRRNRVVEIPEMFGHSATPYLDYLGPDVDIGFRLSAHSAHGEVIASPNLIEAICGDPAAARLRFHPIGEASLKGVIAGQPFPLVLVSAPQQPPARQRESIPAEILGRRLRQQREQLAAQHGVQMAPPVFA